MRETLLSAVEEKMPPKLEDDGKSVRHNMIVSERWLERIDEWRRKQPAIPNRSEAIRILVDQALSAEGKE